MMVEPAAPCETTVCITPCPVAAAPCGGNAGGSLDLYCQGCSAGSHPEAGVVTGCGALAGARADHGGGSPRLAESGRPVEKAGAEAGPHSQGAVSPFRNEYDGCGAETGAVAGEGDVGVTELRETLESPVTGVAARKPELGGSVLCSQPRGPCLGTWRNEEVNAACCWWSLATGAAALIDCTRLCLTLVAPPTPSDWLHVGRAWYNPSTRGTLSKLASLFSEVMSPLPTSSCPNCCFSITLSAVSSAPRVGVSAREVRRDPAGVRRPLASRESTP